MKLYRLNRLKWLASILLVIILSSAGCTENGLPIGVSEEPFHLVVDSSGNTTASTGDVNIYGDNTTVINSGGSGNITLPIDESDVTNLVADLAGKQSTLVSGTNIKTINGSSVLGSGNLVVSAGAETDPVYSASASTNVTPTKISNWDTAYAMTFSGSLNKAVNDVSLSGDNATPGDSKYYGTNGSGTKGFFDLPAAGGYIPYIGASDNVDLGTYSLTTTGDITGNNLLISAWNTAVSWGNHALVGYLTSITSTNVTVALGYTPADNVTAMAHINNTSNPHNVTANQVVPNQTGNATKYLYTDGSSVSWESVSLGAETDPIYSSSNASLLTADNFTMWNQTTANLTSHIGNTSNPHSVTKTQVGLSNVDNTADANKSVAYATNSGTSTSTNQTHVSGDLATSTNATGQLDGGVLHGIYVVCISNTTALATGNGTANMTIPLLLNGWNLIAVQAHVYTVSSSGTPTINVYNATDSQSMLSTAITIDANEKDSSTATAAVINTSYDDVATGDELRIDVSVAGTGTKGLDVILTFWKP